MAIPGMLAVIFSVTTAGGVALYYTGAMLMLCGITAQQRFMVFLGENDFHKKTGVLIQY